SSLAMASSYFFCVTSARAWRIDSAYALRAASEISGVAAAVDGPESALRATMVEHASTIVATMIAICRQSLRDEVTRWMARRERQHRILAQRLIAPLGRPQGAIGAPFGGSAAAKPQAWGSFNRAAGPPPRRDWRPLRGQRSGEAASVGVLQSRRWAAPKARLAPPSGAAQRRSRKRGGPSFGVAQSCGGC